MRNNLLKINRLVTESFNFRPTVRIALLFLFLGLSSCADFLQVDPVVQLPSGDVFSTDKLANSALAGMYSSSYSTTTLAFIYRLSTLPGLSADELSYFPNATFDQFKNNAIPTADAYALGIWSNLYQVNYYANAIIEGAAASTGMTNAFKAQATGEAKFMRAFCHFYLTNLYGAVPIVTSTDVLATSVLPRSPQADVYTQILADLTEAQNLLVADYSASGNERIRPNKSAATALMARVYLYTGNYARAEELASQLIANATLYGLVPSLNSVFLKNSKEAIWQFAASLGYTAESLQFLPSGTSLQFVLRNEMVNAFETGDQRKVQWTNFLTTNPSAVYPFKYKVSPNSTQLNTEYGMVFRLAEQYLIRAEARAQQGNLSGAQTDLNAIRSRAGLANTTATDKAALLLAVEKERRVELFSEWGHRWFDLKRTNRADAVLSAVKPTFWKSSATLYPIPTSAINSNVNLTQNSGY